MQTRNGIKVTKLMKLENCYVGIVKGKLMQWNHDGMRTGRNRSKLDLILDDPKAIYVNVFISGGIKRVSSKRYSSMKEAVENAPRGYVKTIEL